MNARLRAWRNFREFKIWLLKKKHVEHKTPLYKMYANSRFLDKNLHLIYSSSFFQVRGVEQSNNSGIKPSRFMSSQAFQQKSMVSLFGGSEQYQPGSGNLKRSPSIDTTPCNVKGVSKHLVRVRGRRKYCAPRVDLYFKALFQNIP